MSPLPQVLSFLFGVLIAPLIGLGLRLLQDATPSAASARVHAAIAISIAAALACLIPVRAASRPRRTLGGALVLAGAAAGSFVAASASVSIPLLLGSFVATAIGLRLLGAAVSTATLLIGLGIGVGFGESIFIPRFGATPLLIVAAVLIAVLPRPAPGTSDPTPIRWIDLLAASIAVAAFFEFTRPFVLQHLEGTRASHAALSSVLLLGGGLGALVGHLAEDAFARGRVASLLLRAAAPILFVWASLRTLGILEIASNPRLLADLTEVGGFRGDASIVIRLLAVACVCAGIWIGIASRGAPAAPRVALAMLAAAGGAWIAHRSLDHEGLWPSRLVDRPERLIRTSVLENLQAFRVTSSGLLRSARNNTRAEGAAFLAWQGNRATRTPRFAGLEEEEVRLADQLAEAGGGGGSLLLVGNATANHRVGVSRSTFIDHTVAATIPFLDEAVLASERHVALDELDRLDASRRFRAIVVLSSPVLFAESARPLTESALARLKRRLTPDGILLVWFDSRSAELPIIAAVNRAVRALFGESRGWIAADGYTGPFLAVEAGALPDLAQTKFSVRIDGDVFDPITSRTNRRLDPIAESCASTDVSNRPLASAATLDTLAELLSARGAVAVGHAIRALSIHSRNYFDIEVANQDSERHVITDAECDALVAAVAAGSDDPFVMNQVRRFILEAFGQQSYERMDRVLLAALERHPEDPGLRFVSGQMNFALLDHESAIEDLEVAVRGDRMQFDAYVLLGRAYSEVGDYASAVSALESAVALDSEDLEAVKYMGITLFRADRVSEAIPYLERVSLSNPDDKEVRAYLERARAG